MSLPDPLPDLSQQLSQWQHERRVRAVARCLVDAAPHWAGSREVVLVFERRAQTALVAGTLTLPFEALEGALAAAGEGPGALEPLNRLAAGYGLPSGWWLNVDVLYDPGRVLERLIRLNFTAAEWQRYSQNLGHSAQQQLHQRAVRSGDAPLQGLLLARRVALHGAYPALSAVATVRRWPHQGVRLTHHWRADFALIAPRALSLLERLYGFGGEHEARALLLALRGMGMLPVEREARLAVQAGYYDGAARLIRDETARHHAADLGRWLHLAPARRERLSILLGLERSSLGTSALEIASDLLSEVGQVDQRLHV